MAAPEREPVDVAVGVLIDAEGQIARRYVGLDGHDPKEVLRDIAKLAAQ